MVKSEGPIILCYFISHQRLHGALECLLRELGNVCLTGSIVRDGLVVGLFVLGLYIGGVSQYTHTHSLSVYLSLTADR